MRRRSLRRVARVVLCTMAVVHLLEALLLRRRREELTVLPELPEGSSGTGSGAEAKVSVLSVVGSQVDESTLAAAAAEMEGTGAKVVDLVPGDLPAERALAFLQRINPERLGYDPMYAPGGAHEAVAVHSSVAQRMGIPPEGERLERRALVRKTITSQRYAPTSGVVRVAPALKATRVTARDRWGELAEGSASAEPYASLAPVLFGISTAWLATLTAGALLAPVAGAAALATWSIQPSLVFGGRKAGEATLVPSGVTRSSLLRLPLTWVDQGRMALAGYREVRATNRRRRVSSGSSRSSVPPMDVLFEPRLSTCPWCRSPELMPRLDTTDLIQQKPGTFHLDECADCGHIFQNPALSIDGLDYYYQDFYDGVSGEAADSGFAFLSKPHQGRIEAVARFTEPRSWLDIGTGHAHFCLAARQRWPEARFDGLDLSESVEEAQRRGWIEVAHRGLLPELADGLSQSYDVVSMHHYLEHTREPRQELAAVAKVLEPGGFLEIEVPDPECGWADRLGRHWIGWFQPQHQHFLPCGNMITELEETGFDVVSVERGPATMGHDLTVALLLAIQSMTRVPHVPWLPAATVADRAKRFAVVAAAAPALAVVAAADHVKDSQLGPDDIGNAYRVVARRRGRLG